MSKTQPKKAAATKAPRKRPTKKVVKKQAYAKNVELIRLRKLAGLSQEQLGRMTADGNDSVRHQSRISSYELGRCDVPLNTALKMVKVINAELRKKRIKERSTVESFAK